MSRLPYRADIDGLRAIAVLLVIFFHAGLGFPGGFIGVDVFFVVSGYLITGLILNEQRSDTFHIGRFYLRRIRRLAPASLVMVIVTLGMGMILLFPTDLQHLATTVVRQQLLASNHYFARHTGYFDGRSDLMPLLHTWSLAVEEQFYIVFPLLLIAMRRWPKAISCSVLILLGAASFIFSYITIPRFPNAAYFLLPCRGWEMLLGAVIRYLPDSFLKSRTLSDTVGAGGLLAIVLCGFLYTSQTPFPGTYAMIPCLGAAAILLAGGHGGGYITSALSNTYLVGIGLLSYSLYLWHWPILAFLRYEFNGELPWGMGIAAVIASFVAGYLSWRFIEVPCRHGVFLQDSIRPVIGLAFSTAAIIACGLFLVRHEGLPARYSSEKQHMIATMRASPPRIDLTTDNVRGRELPVYGNRNGQMTCLLWGDSHAMALNPALDVACSEAGIRCIQATKAGNLPLIGYRLNRPDAERLVEFNSAVYELAIGDPYNLVVLAGYWHKGATDPQFEPCLKRTIDGLTAVGTRVILVRDVPDQRDHFHKLVGSSIKYDLPQELCGVTLLEHRERQHIADGLFERVSSHQVGVVDPTPFLIDSANRCQILVDGESLYVDGDHLSLLGCQRLTPMFRGQLGKFLQVSHGHSMEQR